MREELTDDDGNLTVEVGDSIEIVVSGRDESSGTLMLGSRHARRMHGIDELRQAFEDQHPVEGRVTGTIKGGPEVDVADYTKPKWSPGTLGDLLRESRKKQK